MKKTKVIITILAAAVLFAFAPVEGAFYTVQIDSGLYPSGRGGEFRVDTLESALVGVLEFYAPETKNKGLTPSFQSFCLETGEVFSPGTMYDATISNAAIFGGVGSADPISKGTADLYYRFATNTWAGGPGYNYGAGRTISAGLLQDTIWWLEGEAGDPGDANPYRHYVVTTYGAVDITGYTGAMADNAGLFPVQVLNMWTLGHAGDTGYRAQDQLVVTPIPAAAWLLGSGLIGLVAVRRRIKR